VRKPASRVAARVVMSISGPSSMDGRVNQVMDRVEDGADGLSYR
jgi:hypothetical protein